MTETAPLQAAEHRELVNTLKAVDDAVRSLGPGHTLPASQQAQILSEAYEKSLYAANRLGKLLVAARFEAGEFAVEKTPVSVRELIDDAVAEVELRARENGVELHTKLESTPPILGDPRLLRSLMSNLLSGTIGVSERGTSLLVSAFQRNDEILIKLEDQGEGITSRLFPDLVKGAQTQNGERLASDKPIDIGTLTAKPIVDSHGGRLWVERQGKTGGALFLTLPPSSQPVHREAPATKKVLIVDDDPDGAFMLEQVLVKGGYETEIAHDGLSGLAKAKSPDIGLVLLDVMLPGMDGFEVCHRLRSDGATAELPIVMISAKSRPEDKETGRRMGANAYMTKPLSLAEVLEKVADLILEAEQ